MLCNVVKSPLVQLFIWFLQKPHKQLHARTHTRLRTHTHTHTHTQVYSVDEFFEFKDDL